MISTFFNRFLSYFGVNRPEPINNPRKRSLGHDYLEISSTKRPRIDPSFNMNSKDFLNSAFTNTGAIKRDRTFTNPRRSFKNTNSLSRDDITHLPTPGLNGNSKMIFLNKPGEKSKKVPVINLEDQENDIEIIDNKTEPKSSSSFNSKMRSKSFHFGSNQRFSSLSSENPHHDKTLTVIFDLDEKRRYHKLLSSYIPTYQGPSPTINNFKHPQHQERVRTKPSNRNIQVIDLANTDDAFPDKILVKPRDGSAKCPIDLEDVDEPTVLTQRNPNVKFCNSFEKKLKNNKFFHTNWINDLEEKFINKRKETEQSLKNELERKELLKKHNHKAIYLELEERLKKNLTFCHDLEEFITKKIEADLPELTTEMLEEIKKALEPNPQNQVMVNRFNVTIIRKDIVTLDGLNWLNDAVINFYMELLMERSKQGKYPKVYCFNTFFYSKLLQSGHAGLKRWTRKVDLFSYDMICIPIHLGVHWCMAIVDFRKKIIGFYDSMGSRNDLCLSKLKGYLQSERLDKKKESFNMDDWKLDNVKDIPHQMNGSDCGVFSCMFAEFLSRDAPLNFSQKNMAYFRNKMVYEIIHAKLLI